MTNFRPTPFFAGLSLAFLSALSLLSSCGQPAPLLKGGTTQRVETKNNSDTKTMPLAKSSDAGKKDSDTHTLQRDVSDSGTGFQVKSIPLLRSSITSCIGSNLTTITGDMFVGAAAQAAEEAAAAKETPPRALPGKPLSTETKARLAMAEATGRTSFLNGGGRYTDGVDIFTTEAGNLYDPNLASRAGTGADQISDSYLRSLSIIANVVAHNCDVNGQCDCSSREKAAEMVKRCFPQLDPASTRVKKTTDLLTSACSSPLSLPRRKAVASMLSSYAFASAR